MDCAGIVRCRPGRRRRGERAAVQAAYRCDVSADDRFAPVHSRAMGRGSESRAVAGSGGGGALHCVPRAMLLSRDPAAKERPWNAGQFGAISSPRRANGPAMIELSGVNVSDESSVPNAQRIQTLTIAAAIIYACRGKESLEDALTAAHEILERVENDSK
jgi:hypothetical protein